jgi:hypothetical protein
VAGINIPSTASGAILLNNLNLNISSNFRATAMSSQSSNTPLIFTNSTINTNADDFSVSYAGFGNNDVSMTNDIFNTVSTGSQSFGVESVGPGSITLNSSTINSMGFNNVTALATVYGSYLGGTGSMVINDSTITASQAGSGNGGGAAIYNQGASSRLTVNRTNATARSNKTFGMAGIRQAFGGSTTTVNGGTISAFNSNTGSTIGAVLLEQTATGTMTLNDATLVAQGSTSGIFPAISNQSLTTGNVIINNGSVSVNNSVASTAVLNAINQARITVNGTTKLIGNSVAGSAFGARTANTARILVNGASLQLNSTQSSAFAGTALSNTNFVTYTGSNITILGNGSSAFKTVGSNTVTKDGTTVCSVNGTPC